MFLNPHFVLLLAYYTEGGEALICRVEGAAAALALWFQETFTVRRHCR